MEEMWLEKIEISGPTLASLIQRVSSSPGDIDGLLFGHVTYTTPLTLSDESSNESSLIATVTSFFSSTSTATFYSSSGQIDLSTLTNLIDNNNNNNRIIGWFSARRKTHLRPSMRESLVTSSLSSSFQLSSQIHNSPHTFNPCVFILLTTPFPDQLIHTHQYKAFQFQSLPHSFIPKTLDVVNLGPAFRGHYGNFIPNSPFPDLPFELKGFNCHDMIEDNSNEENHKFGKLCDVDFQIGRLKNLMGSEAATYTSELEDLYNNMINKINALAKLVEQSSAKLLQQEGHNMKLRHKVAGFE